ncbi:hypothetical protein H8E65_05505 [Candidatus Bathyarchaeota archaeon]|nr:hypothetical protein [Candidatus Bathyarchaeota archaeon]
MDDSRFEANNVNPIDRIDRIEAYVKANVGCSEDEVADALGLHLFDVLEGLHELERLGRLRSEPL